MSNATPTADAADHIPRGRDDDYTAAMARSRREMLTRRTGTDLCAVAGTPIDPAAARGNIDTAPGTLLSGAASNGEHAARQDAADAAETCAATVPVGEVSPAAAVVHGDGVTAHERLGRNRPAA